MITPFLTTNILLINIAVMLFVTSVSGGIMTLIWLAVGQLLEQKGYVNIAFELMKLSAFFYVCPVGYIILKVFEMEIGRGYLFSPTENILMVVRSFLIIWGMGTLFMMLHIICDLKQLNKRYADAFPCDCEMQDIYAKVVSELGMAKHIRKNIPKLCQSYHASVPCIKGVRKSMIILPVREYSDEELRVVFIHELTHHRQGDVRLKMLMKVLLALHFYNPFAWLLFLKVHTWSEYACDYRSCNKIGGMKSYFEAIVNMSADEPVRVRLSSQLVETKHELVGRIKRMKKVYGKKRSGWSAALILSAAFMASTLSVSAATVGTAELYCGWNKATVVEIDVTDKQPVYEYYTEQGDAEGITTVEGEISRLSRSTTEIDWTIGNNVKMVSPYFVCEEGDVVDISVTFLPSNATVKLGIERNNGTKVYVNATGHSSPSFDIDVTGTYRVFIENTSGQSVTADGSYNYY